MYEKYYQEIVKTINSQINLKFQNIVNNGVNVLDWTRDNQRELYSQERKLDAEVNEAWKDTPLHPSQEVTHPVPSGHPSQEGNRDFEVFKKTTLAWGRVTLSIFKKYRERAI
ncbi:MAG: hypothetical protein DWB56_06830 [Candidatus Jettenia sp.]|uniref:Uncharacterized protein n=1 Tax=Candidatus Jettenia caeni TaxID=247490 RepID=I3IMY6_9BACT|nr:hypothetical protein [Candidatus Jettenia sp. AMX1]MBC6928668.1 hypothetical protein [Candidatus Jettenia sp.]GAB63081.1 hypothetical protein KSU1_C1485 [Candidatus Jettenia caeni]KAA0250646.1 MAG: hypothetical protein EDM77_03770 [Candidatus Jettenia sp. AMX1]MCE7879980.1 hypothetical protein [Candidatus Jettenia sp. AMX1]MCQ3926762.1 hypothetical protein [Candidatus Jettenia sp.]